MDNYVIDVTDEAANAQLAVVLQIARPLLARIVSIGGVRIGVAAILIALIERHQVPGTPFDPERAHILCESVHRCADVVVVGANITKEQLEKHIQDLEQQEIAELLAQVPDTGHNMH